MGPKPGSPSQDLCQTWVRHRIQAEEKVSLKRNNLNYIKNLLYNIKCFLIFVTES